MRSDLVLAQNTVNAPRDVLIRVAISHELARHSRDKAEDDFPSCSKVLGRGHDPFIYIGADKRLVVVL